MIRSLANKMAKKWRSKSRFGEMESLFGEKESLFGEMESLFGEIESLFGEGMAKKMAK